ncbi:Lpg1974 family pore-forming outer membrane protein [Legionella fairfieldensis]|uniref:Lpg1974 family pore-forming outer membrane protein n=1 Tax=Legionella fairfieldensis TaxID=45064 RepID=UPI00048BEAF5|nr:Lpg1974 family pore-forming outer membrane protein [Legionella fairfieldensis]
MLNLKKTAVAVLALGSSAVFAGTMGPVCTPGNVTVPCERTAWDFGAQALYLQTTLSNGDRFFGFGDVTAPAGLRNFGDNNWAWGFQIEGSYHFQTGNDFNVNWYHLTSSGSDRSFDGFYSFNQRPRWDAVNFELGQHVDFSEWSTIRFHGGAQYGRIGHHHRHYYLGALARRDRSTFNGFGPRIGADLGYQLGNGLSVYAKGATALLVGSNRIDYSSDLYPIDPVFDPNYYPSRDRSRSTVVPELEGKLGAKYTYAMAQGDITLDAGYMWVNYFNAQRSVNPVFLGGSATPVAVDVRESNFGINGPYLGLKWVGNV